MGIAYAVTSWLVVQVSDVVIHNIGAPEWLFKAILLLLGIGFPLVMIFAWGKGVRALFYPSSRKHDDDRRKGL